MLAGDCHNSYILVICSTRQEDENTVESHRLEPLRELEQRFLRAEKEHENMILVRSVSVESFREAVRSAVNPKSQLVTLPRALQSSKDLTVQVSPSCMHI